MNSTVTVWTSNSTALAQNRVAQLLRATRTANAAYDSISVAECTDEQATEKIEDAFHRLVSLTTSDSTLHLVAVVPLFDPDASSQMEILFEACDKVQHKISLHVIGLVDSIGSIFNQSKDQFASPDQVRSSILLLGSLTEKYSIAGSYSLIDDYAESGAPIRFTIESLARYIALQQKALMQDYYKILSPALLSTHAGDNLAIGVASLSFDREGVARQMLGLGFLEALNHVGINDSKVDAQKAVQEAEMILAGIRDRYPRLFDNRIIPLYKDENMKEGEVVAQAANILDKDILELKTDILSLLSQDDLTLPEKESVLALVLGRDNERICGMQYHHDGALLDDACEYPINLYVEAFNSYCKGTQLLPVRGDFEALKMYVWVDEKKEYKDSPENQAALNPLDAIKQLKQDIINTAAYIRDKQNELNDLQNAARQRRDAEEIERKWIKPSGEFKDIEYKEQPLDEQYTPAQGLRIKDALDLRSFFTPVKSQQNLGSCTSFAVVAMYEAMMSRSGVVGENNMSPAYLFYHSNILKGRPQGGSNFHEQFEMLGKHGVCYEELYEYSTKALQAQPSEQAHEDAKRHRVLSAKQIPLFNGSDKSDTLKRNHTILTSALSEGYPVGISLKVFDNLGKDGAFILHPEDAPNAKEEGWHAMVIVGYSEENNLYIVRNSWGTDFGDNGYCYMPDTYIDDPDYMDFACIITEITDGKDGGVADIPTVVANFASTESEIRIAAIRNSIAKMRIELKNSQNLYAEYYKYYQRLVLQLTMPKVQNEIRQAAENAQLNSFIRFDARKSELEATFVPKFKKYKKGLQQTLLILGVVTLGLGIGWYYSESIAVGIICLVSLVLTIMTFLGYKWWKKLKHRELQEELDRAAVEAQRQKERLFEMQMRFHVAGMWLQRFHKLTIELGDVYDRLVSFNGCLRGWEDTYSRQIGQSVEQEGQMFRLLDTSSRLHRYFNDNKSAIVADIDLIRLFEDYRITPDEMEVFHRRLEETVMSVITSLMGRFNIANFLLGDEYAYLDPVEIQDGIADLINVGQPPYRNRAMNATSPIRILMVNVEPEREAQWIATTNALFPLPPIQLDLSDSNTLILLTIHPQVRVHEDS